MTKKPSRKAFKPYAEGSRLPVPQVLNSLHTCYLADRPTYSEADAELVLAELERYIHQTGLAGTEIDVLSADSARAFTQEASEASARIAKTFAPEGMNMPAMPDLLYAQQATVHSDEAFEGTVFVSLVLRTGPSPYLLQTFHTEYNAANGGSLRLHTTDRTLEVGDVLVLDPTTPHMAIPTEPSEDSMLVLMQLSVAVPDQETLMRLMEQKAPWLEKNKPPLLF